VSLTPAQHADFAAHLAANTATVEVPVEGVPTAVPINAVEPSPDNAFAVAQWYNQTATPDYFVWRSDVPAKDIFDQVVWANFTPTGTVDQNTTAQAAQQITARGTLCQGKQFNLQIILQGQSALDASKKNVRAGLMDALTNLPSGNNGNIRDGGWAAVLPVLSRKALRAERVFAFDDGAGTGNTTTDPRGAQTNPDGLTREGSISDADVRAVWGI
jgi:hypothetical protein